ncbi:2693_t:CDS:2, partial [Rhizophagus irregularis]
VEICTGNSLFQIQCFAAFASLFSLARKMNYMKSTGIFYAFDEALETFGIKFIKENITGNVYKNENLKRQINSIAFKSLNSTNHPLFQNCIELTDSSYTKLFSYYDKGKERLNQIYRQEVLRIDPINTKGRRAKEVVITKTKDIKNAECTSKKCPTHPKPSNKEIEKVLDSLLKLSPNY